MYNETISSTRSMLRTSLLGEGESKNAGVAELAAAVGILHTSCSGASYAGGPIHPSMAASLYPAEEECVVTSSPSVGARPPIL